MNRITREEIIAIAFFALVFLTIGAIGGYMARSVTSRDRLLNNTADLYFTEREYYQKQIDQIMKQGSQGGTKHGK